AQGGARGAERAHKSRSARSPAPPWQRTLPPSMRGGYTTSWRPPLPIAEELVNAARGSNVPPRRARADRQSSAPPERCYLDTTAGGYSRRRCPQDAFGCVVLLELGLRFARRGEIRCFLHPFPRQRSSSPF